MPPFPTPRAPLNAPISDAPLITHATLVHTLSPLAACEPPTIKSPLMYRRMNQSDRNAPYRQRALFSSNMGSHDRPKEDGSRRGSHSRHRDERREERHRSDRSSRSHRADHRDRSRSRSPRRASSSRRERDDKEDRHHRHRHGGDRRRDAEGRRSEDPRRHSEKRRRDEDRDADTRRGSSSRQKIIDDDEARAAKVDTRFEEPHPESYSTQAIPAGATLDLRSRPAAPSTEDDPAPLPHGSHTQTHLRRDNWMLAQPSSISAGSGPAPDDEAESEATAETSRLAASTPDFFDTLGEQRVKKPKEEKPDPEQLHISSRELNKQLVEGKELDEYRVETKKKLQYGAPGFQWRMMKLRKTYEQAEEEGRAVEEVASERYGDMDAFNEARAERQWLDDRGNQPNRAAPKAEAAPSGRDAPPSRRFMFADALPGNPLSTGTNGATSMPLSRQSSFRKPGEASGSTTPQIDDRSRHATPSFAAAVNAPKTTASLSGGENATTPAVSKPSTPIPSVFTPTSLIAGSKKSTAPASNAVINEAVLEQGRDAVTNPPLDSEALNKLEAKVLKAEMMGKANAPALREKLLKERERATKGGDKGIGYFPPAPTGEEGSEATVQVLPTLDGRGRLYDVGTSRTDDSEGALPPGNRRRSNKKFETRDATTGEVVRYSADDDQHSLADLVRQEKFSAGMSDQKNFDADFANRIASDASFRTGVDYLDDNVEKMSRKKMRSDALKRQFAINDFAKTKKALESCRFCWRGGHNGMDDDEEKPPLARVIATGTRAYLALPETEPLVAGHALIVPIQHHLNMLEADDDVWEEVKNFMKCLLQMAAAEGEDRSYVFYETVLSLRQQRHTCIEAVPLPRDLLETLPGHFQVELSSVEGEWSQNKKVIEFTPQKPFRRSMVSQLPYFMVQFDHKGERGYGHVIEGTDAGSAEDGRGAGADGGNPNDAYAGNFMSGHGSGAKFEHFFAAEIIGNLLDLEPRAWRNPKRLRNDPKRAEELQRDLAAKWAPFDWTKMLRGA
ncbi:unnamed protein product [Parajaminaea phylloscopi]